MKYAADNEKKNFDFGRSSPNEGTYKFKKQWGAEPVQLYWHRLNKVRQEKECFSSNSARKLLESVWQKMPLSVVNVIGPKVRKYIDL